MALGDQHADHRDHLVDEFRGAGLGGGFEAAQGFHIGLELVGGFFGDAADGLVQRQFGKIPQRPCVDLVIHVGDVAHVGDVFRPIEMAEQPEQHVKDDDGAGIADMGEIIDRGAADIHAHVRRIEGFEVLLLAGERVIKAQGHDFSTVLA